jgi:hypothetical protein
VAKSKPQGYLTAYELLVCRTILLNSTLYLSCKCITLCHTCFDSAEELDSAIMLIGAYLSVQGGETSLDVMNDW